MSTPRTVIYQFFGPDRLAGVARWVATAPWGAGGTLVETQGRHGPEVHAYVQDPAWPAGHPRGCDCGTCDDLRAAWERRG